MRITFSYFILLFGTIQLLTASTGNSQELHQISVTISAQKESMKAVLRKIEQKTGMSFVLPMNEVDTYIVESLPGKRRDVKTTLDLIFANTDLGYRQINKRSIVVYVKNADRNKKTPSSGSAEIDQAKEVVPPSINGKVVDEKGDGLPGVSIMLKGTQQGTITNENGHFQLDAGEGAVLVLSFVGYETQEFTVKRETFVSISMKVDQKSFEEIVVVGYGTQKKTSLTAAVSSMKGEEISKVPTTNLSNNLGGRLAGVIVRQNSGEPGRDESSIYVRGISSTGNNQPLLIVDGIPRDFQKLDPNTIESLTVLKDAAAVAPYGVAGANGVVLVTTKRGKPGAPTLTYNGYVGFQNPTAYQKHVSPYEFALLKNLAAQNDGLPIPYTEQALQKFRDGTRPDVFPVDDVWKALTKKNALLTNHNVEVNGGTERARYYAAFGYQHQAGLWHTTGENKYNLALNIDADVTSITKLSFNLNGRLQKDWYPPIGTSRIFELIGYSHPARGGPLVFSNGMYGKFIMGSIYNKGYARENTTSLFSQLSLEQKVPFIPGLNLRGTVAFDPTYGYNKTWLMPVQLATIDTTQTPHVIKDGVFGQAKSSLTEASLNRNQLTFQGGFNYAKSFGKNAVSVIGVFESKENSVRNFGAVRRNYDLDIPELNMGSSSQADLSNSGSSSLGRQIGVVYRVSYDYADKYMVEASGRYDGSYYFPANQRYGFFPAFSAGWRISEENFLKNHRVIDNLKLRASYGEVGALAGSDYQYLTLYGVSSPAYVMGGSAVQAITERAEPNRNITWERAKKTDVGVELSAWKGLLNLEIDYFFEKRSNMLTQPDVIVPDEYGIGLSQVNAGIMSNRGFEFAIASNYRISPDLQVSLGTNFTFAKNKLIQTFETPATFNNPNRRRTGRQLGTQFGLESLGFFKAEDFDEAGNLKEGIAVQPWGKVRPGDIRYADLNNDGKIDINDETVIGESPIPQIIYGISPSVKYKNFSVDLLFQGAGNRNFYLEGDGAWLFFNGMGAFTENLDYWTPEHQNARNPRVTSAPTPNNTQRSSFWMENAAYLRLKNMLISYNLPANLVKQAGLQHVRLYVSGQNVVTWSKIKRFDPEVSNVQGRMYPQQRVTSLGLNITF
ncbi:TonB-dependent receptor [Ravibacter arvi]|uniref:TonB-dependent receptor n=1 Tax=Ravibacter arvi TaxID=2051041 RepID=A0ABP8M0D8_9BACT